MTTKKQFDTLWKDHFPETVPISHRFKLAYPDRWFRVHSLPKSKRYAGNDKEWETLLTRQNEIITDIFGLCTTVFLVANDADWEMGRRGNLKCETDEKYSFTKLDNADLYKLDSDYYENDYMLEKNTFKPIFAEITWEPHLHDLVLKEIANDDTRAFFVSFVKNIIVAPYDGGVDFVLKDNLTRDLYKKKYTKWLSDREDGL